MRATSPPTALSVAAAALPLVVAALAPLAVPSAALAERWLRPVPGDVARPFSYARVTPFAAGAHRGADLDAAPGTQVRSACAGTVVHAGPVADHGTVVSVRCGRRRVSYLPLASVVTRAGATVAAGTPLGAVAPGHGGLHLGVRREADRFGYEDPAALLAKPARPATPLPPPSARLPRPARRRLVRIRAPRSERPLRERHPLHRAPPASEPLPQSRPSHGAPPQPGPLPQSGPLSPASRPAAAPPQIPLPVWAGLALLLAGAAGSGAVVARRRRVSPSRVVVAAESAR